MRAYLRVHTTPKGVELKLRQSQIKFKKCQPFGILYQIKTSKAIILSSLRDSKASIAGIFIE
jgi:hypothetical protein